MSLFIGISLMVLLIFIGTLGFWTINQIKKSLRLEYEYKRSYYYASYIVKGGTFGATEFNCSEKITWSNVTPILKDVIKKIEKDIGAKEIIILNFQELEE